MSLEAIASAAGVSKITLYRRWNSRLALARAYRRGELREDLPFTILADMFAGPIFYHLTVLAPVELDTSKNMPELLTQAILKGIAKQEP
jgi:AcrR family transcriptional regulator